MKIRFCEQYRGAASLIQRLHSGTNRLRPRMAAFRERYRRATTETARAAFAAAFIRERDHTGNRK